MSPLSPPLRASLECAYEGDDAFGNLVARRSQARPKPQMVATRELEKFYVGIAQATRGLRDL